MGLLKFNRGLDVHALILNIAKDTSFNGGSCVFCIYERTTIRNNYCP